MFGSLGVPELIFIFALALLIFGPRKLPEIGRTIGRGLSEFRKASTELKRSINTEMIEDEVRKSDPRRILNDDPPASSTEAEADGDGEGAQPPDVAGEPTGGTPPAGSVARSAGDDPAGDDPAGDDPAGASSHLPSSGGTPASDEPAGDDPADPEAS